MKTRTLSFLALFGAFTAGAQDMQQKIDMAINGLGDATISISMTLGAQQWQMWNQSFGNDPAALKRDLERSMPAYFLEDVKLDKKDMDRSFTVSLKAPGICKVDKKGRWMLTTDQKNAQITELGDGKFMMVQSPKELGGNVQQTTMITFPDDASDIRLEKDPFGKSVFQFEMDEPTGTGGLMLWLGLGLMLAGTAWLGVALFR
jgi:hypothetical protein